MSKLPPRPGERESIMNLQSIPTSDQKTLSTSTTHRSHVTARADSLIPTNDSNEQWMSRHTAASFPKLHATVYHYIDLLVKLHSQSVYAQQWLRLTDPNLDGPTMFKRMNWTQMGNCLKIKDFHQYCDFVMRCPGIGEYLKLIVNKGAFELTTLKPWNSIELNQKKELQDIDATSTISNTDTIQLGQKECDESTEQIRLLLQQAVPLFQYYIKLFPNDQYARLCQEWFNNGLTEDSTINDLYTTCQLTTLEDLFFLLRLSPALKTYMSFHFEGNKIIYQVHSSLPDLQPSPPTTPSSTLTVASTIQDSKTWVVFHRLIFPLVRSWGSEQQASHIAYAWNSAMDAGLTENSTWEDFQILFDIKNFSEYY